MAIPTSHAPTCGPGFYEFFAGGGMARLGLGEGWRGLFANDLDPRKAASYARNFGDGELVVGDVEALTTADLPARADLAWASFPCQDLSLAGPGGGLDAGRSGAFRPFWALMRGLAAEGRAPAVVALENVCGALTSNGGRDFAALARALAEGGYRFGALVIDAARFLPQSRPRLFVVAVRDEAAVPPALLARGPREPFHTAALVRAVEGLDPAVRARALWWDVPPPPPHGLTLADVLEDAPAGVAWDDPARTDRLLSLMSPLNRAKVEAARRGGAPAVGAVYRRTRREDAAKVQRAEVRFDALAGCLRTPAGGSSRQTILVVEGASVRSRLLSGREAARLMGLPDSYVLPPRLNDALHLAGDGVAPPVVAHLARTLFEPLLGIGAAARSAA